MSQQGSEQPSQQPSQGQPDWGGPFRGERRWVLAGLAVLLIFAIGSAIYNGGWSQGFGMGLLAGGASGGASGGETATTYMHYRGYGFHPFGFFGGFFRILFFVFVFAMIAKIFGFWRWKMRQGHHAHWQGERWQGGPWQHGPWSHGYGQPGPSQPGQSGQPQGQEPQPGSQLGPEGDRPKNTVWLDV